MDRVYLQAQVPRMPFIGRLRRSPLGSHAAEALPQSVRPFLRSALIRKRRENAMEPADRQYLLDYYREDTRKLADLLSRNPGVMPYRIPDPSRSPAWLCNR